MPRSPITPFSKRMRTMDDDPSDDEGYLVARLPSTSRFAQSSRVSGHRGDTNPSEGDREKATDGEENFGDDEYMNGDDDDDDDDDDDSDDDDEDDEDYIGNEADDDDEILTIDSDSLSGMPFRNVYMRDLDDVDSMRSSEFIEYDSEEPDEFVDNADPEIYLRFDPTPNAPYPKPDWLTLNELRQRKCGVPSQRHMKPQSSMLSFEKNVKNSLWMIQRLELSKRLEEHTGCVNSLDFNSTGNLICSGSDDLAICIWDWQLNKLRKKINSGHTNNVFWSQFCCSDSNIITSARDGTVRLLDVETSRSRTLLVQAGEIKQVAFITPQTLVTCGSNASVNFIDLRTRDSTKLFIVRNPSHNRTCALHSIDAHPLDRHKIVVAGASPYVFLYDLRRIARNPSEVEHKPTYCLDKFEDTSHIVTATAFNPTGDKLLISFNDDDLYCCRSDTCEIIHHYKGHRNRKTLIGCAWFGDNFVLSGSDDGHIYGWDLESEHIVCFLEGDVKGVVNTLVTHPNLPVLATSGYDHNVKVWEPISKIWPQTLKGIKPMICKNTLRRKRALSRLERVFQEADTSEESDDWTEIM